MVILTTPHRRHTYERGPRQSITLERRVSPCRTLNDILTEVEVPMLLMNSWFAYREPTGERITLETPLLEEDNIVLREPTDKDWAAYRASLPEPPRVYTEEEVRAIFLRHVWSLIQYWERVESRDGPKTTRDRLSGLAHSLLSTLDGCSLDLPGFSITPCPHKDDQAYREKRGENWFPDNVDIGGGLHEVMYKYEPKAPTNNMAENSDGT